MKHKLSEAAREARNAYMRDYNKRNPEKRKAYLARYWEKKAKQSQTATNESETESEGK